MSKNTQRRASAYASGRLDAKSGRNFRWKKHPMLYYYRKGYNEYKKKDEFKSLSERFEIWIRKIIRR